MATASALTPVAARARWWWIPYLYLLRIQIVIGIVLLFGPPVALSSPLLRGLFDLHHDSAKRTVISVTFVTLAALSASWTLLATTWAALYNAPDRFGTSRIKFITFPITWPERESFAIFALPTVGASLCYSRRASHTPIWWLGLGVIFGVVAAIVVLYLARWSADLLQEAARATRRRDEQNVATRAVRRMLELMDRDHLRDGYIDRATGDLAPGHALAVTVFALTSGLYLAIGIGKWVRLGYESNVSTLACVLLLLMMVCWFGAGLTFLLDQSRIPLLAVVAVAAFVVGMLPVPGSDHVYRTSYARTRDQSPFAHDVLNLGSRTPIVIAATGGGIQAAAWTARVLTGIDEALPADLKDAYTHSIRLLSTVSGGGVGAMYFSERYGPEGFNRRDSLDNVVGLAEVSILDDVAWGTAYPDAVATFFPPIRAVFGDRGQALETALTRKVELGRLLSDWRTQVWSDVRPANIFNATLVDSGERLLLGTSRLGWREERGLRNFECVYTDREIQVVTAVRLAASFTYVSPAARIDVPGKDHGGCEDVPERSGDKRGVPKPYHVVDGGYYDDYGMTTLSEWLDEGLVGVGGARTFPRVLVIQIRSDPGIDRDQLDRWHGPLYQMWAPAETLLNVRATAQISHNDEEFERLQQFWRERHVEIDNVIFRFCGDHPPLSWHLTGSDKEKIESQWITHRDGESPELKAVRAFLRGQPLPIEPDANPYQVPLTACPPNP
jgi:hypothetical protein